MKTFLLLLGCLLATNVLGADSPKSAKFEIRAVVDDVSANADPFVYSQIAAGGQRVDEPLNLDKKVLIKSSDIKTAVVESNPITGGPEVAVTFTKSGAKRFAEATRAHVGKRLAILVDGKVMMAPKVVAEIPGGKAVVTGSFSLQEATELAQRLNQK